MSRLILLPVSTSPFHPKLKQQQFLLLLLVLLHLFLVAAEAATAAAGGGGNLNKDIDVTWGKDHAKVLNQGKLLSLSLDQHSGSAFQSKKQYMYGRFQIQIKLVPGDSAGTDTSFYLSSQGSAHDEIDLEFLGNVSGQPYILHTNVYSRGGGGREQQFYLWFDPTADFHTYSILWTPKHIVLSVDGTPIRQFKNMESSMGVPYPSKQPMRVFGSLWNAEYWATRGGLVKTNWAKAPFIASYRNFHVDEAAAAACLRSAGKSSCSNSDNSSSPAAVPPSTLNSFAGEMDSKSRERMRWVQNKYMIYNYCHDKKKFPHGLPAECSVST